VADVDGLPKNPFNILNGSNNRGSDGILLENELAIDGELTGTNDASQVVFDTGYMPSNTVVGLHQMYVRFFAEGVDDQDNALTVTYYIQGDNGEDLVALSFDTVYKSPISPIIGNGMGLCYFYENYKYRIVIESHASLQDGQQVGVDYVKLVPRDPLSMIGYQCYVSGGNLYVPITFPVRLELTPSGSNYYYSVSYTYPTTMINAIPVACATATNPDYFADITYYDDTGFTAIIANKDGTNWSGPTAGFINVIVSGYMEINSLLPSE
jgi:hypothetical protein